VAAVVLGGCGGKSGETAGVGDEFATKAIAICETALKKKQHWQPFPVSDFDPSDPDPARFPEVSNWLTSQVAPTFRSWLSGLQALGTPPSAQEDWTAMLSVIEKIGDLNEDQIAAAGNHDVAGFTAATAELRSTQDALVAASEKAGVPDCADVHAA